MQMSILYNKGDRVTIMNGFQAYRTRTPALLAKEIQRCRMLGINVGIKLVRGAYMNEERKLAEKKGVPSPIWSSIEETHKSYNASMDLALKDLRENDRLFVASHNLESVEKAKNFLNENPSFNDGRVFFGQLKGFSDQITGQLAQEGFEVYKYLPYGPTEDVMPYLLRRGQESKQVVREQKFQNEFLLGELKKRLSFRS